MKKNEIAALQKERLAIHQGEMAPGRVWELTRGTDGKVHRKQVAPEVFRRKQARAWEVKTEAARIRHKINLTQQQFAESIGVSLATLRKWESGASQPTGAARVLLKVVEMAPDVARRASKAVFAES
ncbi:MAG TPA: helix-turn-helix domain-containing protein [Chthoniobacteraceae bacterium]|nr:helix-turn-helix domain-containing protein [Chthoniobacteraceae bacterium]